MKITSKNQVTLKTLIEFLLSIIPVIMFYPILAIFNELSGPVYSGKYLNAIQVCVLYPRDLIDNEIKSFIGPWPNFNLETLPRFLSREIRICF